MFKDEVISEEPSDHEDVKCIDEEHCPGSKNSKHDIQIPHHEEANPAEEEMVKNKETPFDEKEKVLDHAPNSERKRREI